jgi:FkbM family methyltransferase
MTQYFALNDLDKKMKPYLGYDGGYFIEIGANDGVNQSNTLHFELYHSWRGVLVEPFPTNFFKCRANRSKETKVYCAACVPFDYTERFVPMVYSNLMSAADIAGSDISDARAHALVGKQFLSAEEEVFTFGAEARTLNDILVQAQAPREIDFFSLDVEGAEIPLLDGVDHDRYRFRYLLVEARDLGKISAYLRPKGYELIKPLSEQDYLFTNVRSKTASHL